MYKKFLKIKKIHLVRGYTLIEIVIYIALFTILAMAVVSALVTLTRAFRETTIQSDLVQNGIIMERISREVKQAYGINSISASDLKLDTKDEDDNDKTVRFVLSGTNIQFYENDVLVGNLNTLSTQVTALSFTEITTTEGKAVKFSISVKSTRDTQNRVIDFYETAVLRGDYGN